MMPREEALRAAHRAHTVEGCPFCEALAPLDREREARRASQETPPAGTLDEAWAAAEALVPAGYRLDLSYGYGTNEHPDWLYHASCRHLLDYLGYIGHNPGGPTPAAALRALAARLSEAHDD